MSQAKTKEQLKVIQQSRSQFKVVSMDRFQKVASEILDRIRSLRGDNEGWKTAKQTVCA